MTPPDAAAQFSLTWGHAAGHWRAERASERDGMGAASPLTLVMALLLLGETGERVTSSVSPHILPTLQTRRESTTRHGWPWPQPFPPGPLLPERQASDGRRASRALCSATCGDEGFPCQGMAGTSHGSMHPTSSLSVGCSQRRARPLGKSCGGATLAQPAQSTPTARTHRLNPSPSRLS